jgi:hypothetical protein
LIFSGLKIVFTCLQVFLFPVQSRGPVCQRDCQVLALPRVPVARGGHHGLVVQVDGGVVVAGTKEQVFLYTEQLMILYFFSLPESLVSRFPECDCHNFVFLGRSIVKIAFSVTL